MARRGAREMSNEKPYGHAGEWEAFCPSKAGYLPLCYECNTGDDGKMYRSDNYSYSLCPECFEKHVPPAPAETPEKRPIDPADVDETWVGATVEYLGGADRLTEKLYSQGKYYTVSSVGEFTFNLATDSGRKLWIECKHFTLVKKADGPQTIHLDGGECATGSETIELHTPAPKTRTEVTHSALLEFPNGERVTIPPPPDSEGWEAETLWDEFSEHRAGMHPKVFGSEDEELDCTFPPPHVGDPWPGYIGDVNHYAGRMMCYEYEVRIDDESARIISLTKWTREVVTVDIPSSKEHVAEIRYKLIAKRVNSTWPQRHPPGAVKEREE
jgi:hypothetical protein